MQNARTAGAEEPPSRHPWRCRSFTRGADVLQRSTPCRVRGLQPKASCIVAILKRDDVRNRVKKASLLRVNPGIRRTSST